MGPRPDGRGRRSCRRPLWILPCASMGPRPDGRGRAGPTARRAPLKTRQWGRGRMAAEGGMPAQPKGAGHGCVNGAAAGWPRKGDNTAAGDTLTARVNGAAAGWPRKAVSATRWRYRFTRRQWGRGRMAAEGRRPAIIGRSLNAASMGPRPDGRGRRSTRCASPTAYSRVNGAAAGWPRKAKSGISSS